MERMNVLRNGNLRGVVLLIESDEQLARYVEIELEPQGFEVVWSDSHLRALSILEDRKDVDVVLVMAESTDIGGFDFVHLLRHRNRYAGFCLRVILIASGDSFARFPFEEDGIDDYLLRPFFPGELTWRVGKALRTLRAEKREKASPLAGLLSGIFGSAELKRILHEELNKVFRNKGLFSLVLFRMDGLEAVELNHGQMMVDWMERDVILVIRDGLRSYDRLGWLESRDYCLIAPDVDLASLASLMDRLNDRVHRWNGEVARRSSIQLPVDMAFFAMTVFPDYPPRHLDTAAQALWDWINSRGREAVALPGRFVEIRLSEQGVEAAHARIPSSGKILADQTE